MEQQRKEQEYKTRLAKEQAKKLADEQTKQAKVKQTEQRQNAMIAKFESLPFDKQEQILDQIGAIFANGIFGEIFDKARQNGMAHKDVRFMSYFFKVLEC